jgi:hypothetical protein
VSLSSGGIIVFRNIVRSVAAIAALAVAGHVSAGTAEADAIMVADEAFFLEQAATRFNVPLNEDGFEGVPQGPAVAINRGDFTVTTGNIVDGTNLLIQNDPGATDGVNVLVSPSALGELIFEFAAPTRAFGLHMINMTFPVRATGFVVEIDGQNGFIPMVVITDDPATDFWGMLSDEPFRRIVINNFVTTDDFADFENTAVDWRIDRIRYEDPAAATPVPEPASMLLLGAGLCGVALKGRRIKEHGN